MAHWLLKTEPETYSWKTLVRQKKGVWDGVRNYAARNNLRAMQKGDLCFVYHSGISKAIVGIAKVARTAYQDPTTKDAAWVAVDVVSVKALKRPVTLAEIKAEPSMAEMALVRRGRLSVSPVSAREWKRILAMGSKKRRPR
jgi:predicted RNA-binding protein with PUA-like domain